MAGIYIHIPFCQRRCIYCDFYSTTDADRTVSYVRALKKELLLRRDYLHGEHVETIYFGGGTPSQLSVSQLSEILDCIYSGFEVSKNAEITIECNPDDLSEEYVGGLRCLAFNRVSMGVQSFSDEHLSRLRRRHTAAQAVEAVRRLQKSGIANISIDLIYGLPGETLQEWKKDLDAAFSLDVPHLSAYHLMYEEGTPLYKLYQQHKVSEVAEDLSVAMFETLIDKSAAAGYEHYEISNFCYPDMFSRHNSSYWHGVPYLGCGASAHSFDGRSRQWNVASLDGYIDGVESGTLNCEVEELDLYMRYNDFVMTALRTSIGLPIAQMRLQFGAELSDYCMKMARTSLSNGLLETVERDGDRYLKLTRKGIFVSDDVMSDLMWV